MRLLAQSGLLIGGTEVKLLSLLFEPAKLILMLPTVAAMQAQIIMMSLNRLSNQDRAAASLGYEMNLRAELEIMPHAKSAMLPICNPVETPWRGTKCHC